MCRNPTHTIKSDKHTAPGVKTQSKTSHRTSHSTPLARHSPRYHRTCHSIEQPSTVRTSPTDVATNGSLAHPSLTVPSVPIFYSASRPADTKPIRSLASASATGSASCSASGSGSGFSLDRPQHTRRFLHSDIPDPSPKPTHHRTCTAGPATHAARHLTVSSARAALAEALLACIGHLEPPHVISLLRSSVVELEEHHLHRGSHHTP